MKRPEIQEDSSCQTSLPKCSAFDQAEDFNCPFNYTASVPPPIKIIFADSILPHIDDALCRRSLYSHLAFKSAHFEDSPHQNESNYVFYSACGDEEIIREDVNSIITLHSRGKSPPGLFYITTDLSIVPTTCSGGHIFFVTMPRFLGEDRGRFGKPECCNCSTVVGRNKIPLSEDHGVPCYFFPVPYWSGGMLNMSAWDILAQNIIRRPLIASFAGTMYTWPLRNYIKEFAIFPRFRVTAADWYHAPSSQGYSAKEFEKLMADSMFALCPRGNGISSIRLTQAISSAVLPVLLDDWSLPYGDSLCSFAIRGSLADDLSGLARSLENLSRNEVELEKRMRNMRRFITCYYPETERLGISGFSASFLRHSIDWATRNHK